MSLNPVSVRIQGAEFLNHFHSLVVAHSVPYQMSAEKLSLLWLNNILAITSGNSQGIVWVHINHLSGSDFRGVFLYLHVYVQVSIATMCMFIHVCICVYIYIYIYIYVCVMYM